MGKDEYFQSFRVNADNFMCTLLPGISNHPQIQYSPGSDSRTPSPILLRFGLKLHCIDRLVNSNLLCRRAAVQGGEQQHAARDAAVVPAAGLLQLRVVPIAGLRRAYVLCESC